MIAIISSGFCAPIDKSFQDREDKSPDELGVLLDQVVMDDDAVADRVDAAVGEPEHARLVVAADLHARHIALGEAGDGGDLPGDQRGRAASGIDVGDPDLAGIEAAALHESGPLLKLGRAGRDGNGFALEVLRRLDVGVREHDYRGRIAPVDAGDGPDAHALRDAVADHKAVRKSELRRLAGDELRGAAGTLARTEVDVEAGLLVVALVLRHRKPAWGP